MEDLTLLTFATGAYRELAHRIFLPTLPADIDRAKVLLVGCEEDALPGGTDNAEYQHRMFWRMAYYRQFVEDNMGKKVLFLDCDVVFLRPFKEEMLRYLDEYDFAIQQTYCAGIWGVNCNARTLDFFNRFVNYIAAIPPHERARGFPQFELCNAIRYYVEENALAVLELPDEYGYVTPNTKIYHAINGGASMVAKYFVLNTIQRMMAEKWWEDMSPSEREHFEAASARIVSWVGLVPERYREELQHRMPIERIHELCVDESAILRGEMETEDLIAVLNPSWVYTHGEGNFSSFYLLNVAKLTQ